MMWVGVIQSVKSLKRKVLRFPQGRGQSEVYMFKASLAELVTEKTVASRRTPCFWLER